MPARAAAAASLVIAALAVASPPARAFDGERRGFQIEAGLGAGGIPAEERYLHDGFVDQAFRVKSSIWTRFRGGWGVGSRVALQYVNDVGWTTTDLPGYQDALYVTGSTGIGATYFFRPSAPSLAIEAGLGISTSSMPWASSGDRDRGSGPALWGGVGYEVSRGWIARATVGWAGVAEEWITFGQPDPNQTTAVGITISRLWY